jgi:hypothetical protein
MCSKILWSFIFLGFFLADGFAQKLETELPNTKSKANSTSFFAIKTPLIPQKGNFSCWAATLQMLDGKSNANSNKENTSPIRTDSLSTYLGSYKSDKYARVSDPGWGKIKEHLAANKGLVTYKYFNEKFAHVFLVRGFQEANSTQWLIVNDPWPVNKAKITALAFNQFIRPFNGNQVYVDMNYANSSKSKILKAEPVFNIFSSTSLKESVPLIYTPPLVKVDPKKFKTIKSKDIENLIALQVNLFKNFDANLYQEMKIDFNPAKEELNKDMASLLTLNQFTNTLSFLKYDLKTSTKSDYIFDGLKLAFVNATKNRKPIINITVEYESKTVSPYLYVSRFEKYGTSERAEWDKIKREFEEALKNETIASILNGKPKPSSRKGPSDFYFQSPQEDEEYEIEDISMLPLFGGMVYSFTWPPFDEKIVADPHRQMKLKPRRDAIFVSETGTPYYRLSAVGIPDWGEIISKTSSIGEEWESIERERFFNENKPDYTKKPTKIVKNDPIAVPIDTTGTYDGLDPVDVPIGTSVNPIGPKNVDTKPDTKNDVLIDKDVPQKPSDVGVDFEKERLKKIEELKKLEEQIRIEAAKKKAEEEKKKLEEQKQIEAAKKKAEEEKKKAEAEKERQLKLDEEKKKAEAEKERQRKLDEEKKKAEAEKERQLKLDEEKKKAEAEKERQRKLDEEKKKAEAEKERQRKLDEEKKKAEAEKERQRKLDEEKKKAEAEKERQRKLDEEKKKAEAAKQKGTKG